VKERGRGRRKGKRRGRGRSGAKRMYVVLREGAQDVT